MSDGNEKPQDIRAENERENFRDKDGKLFLVRCPKCKLENYAFAVASGECAWCGWREVKP